MDKIIRKFCGYLLLSTLVTGCGGTPVHSVYNNYSNLITQQNIEEDCCDCCEVCNENNSSENTNTIEDSNTNIKNDKTEIPVETTNKEKLRNDEAAKVIYKKVVERLKSIETYKTTVTSYVKGNIVKQEKLSEPKVGISTINVTFQRPRKMFMNILESKDSPSLNDTRLLYDGGDKVKIKVPGILGLFTFTYPVDKPELSNYRGYSTHDIDTITFQERLDDENAKVKLIGVSQVFNEDMYMLEVSNIKPLDEKITREIIGVRKKDYVVILREMYEGDELVYQDKFDNFRFNIPVTEADFKF